MPIHLPLANLGPMGSPGFLIALWFLAAGIEAGIFELGVRRRGLPRKRVLELALLLNLISWPLFLLALSGLHSLRIDNTDALYYCEAAVVLAEAWGFRALLRQGVPREDRAKVPSFLRLLPVSLAANLVSVGLGFAVAKFL